MSDLTNPFAPRGPASSGVPVGERLRSAASKIAALEAERDALFAERDETRIEVSRLTAELAKAKVHIGDLAAEARHQKGMAEMWREMADRNGAIAGYAAPPAAMKDGG